VLLRDTQDALAEIVANSSMNSGSHASSLTRIGGEGSTVGEVAFDFSMHEVSDVDPFSMMNKITGLPYVAEKMPERPLDINIVLHSDPEEADYNPEWITDCKRFLGKLIRTSVEVSLPGSADSIHSFVIGQKDEDLIDRDNHYIEKTEDPIFAAATVAQLCQQGLTLVVSTFNGLPLDKIDKASIRKNAVGIKANHLFEIELQKDVGQWATGDPKEPFINSARQKPLAKFNKRQAENNARIVASMNAAGVAMAQVVFDRREQPYSFDARSADRSIARAIKRKTLR
jgi:hypothetical protein